MATGPGKPLSWYHIGYSGRDDTRPGRHIGNTARALFALALTLVCIATAAAPVPDKHYRVLVLHTFRQSLPINTDWYTGIVRGFESASALRVDIDIEGLDLTRFSDPGYIADLLEIFRRKYAGNVPDLIIPTYTPALAFLLDHGKDLFPDTPIVFCDADTRFVSARQMPPKVTGITSLPDIAGTARLALQLQPDAQGMAVIVGSDALDRVFEDRARQALQSIGDRVKLTWLQGLPLNALLAAVQRLPRTSPILYLLQLKDRTGESHFPFYTTSRLAAVANAPVYGLWDTLIGHGIIGGRLVTIEADGDLVARMGLRVLRGEAPAAIPIVFRQASPPIVDGRELARWNIGADRLPAETQIRYPQLSVWEAHRKGIMTAILIIVVQGLMIVGLILNRRRLGQVQTALQDEYGRRQQAETLAARLRIRLARFSRERSLGAMATAISHEINQPLIAIQNYAQAAKRRIQHKADDKPKLIELLAKIEGQAERAGVITKRVRSLVSAREPQVLPTSIFPLVDEVIRIMETESENRKCRIAREPADDPPSVLADSLQVQLVLVNLLQNAMQSVCSDGQFVKDISVEARPISDKEVQVSVADRGPGVSPDRIADIFEPLYSGSTGGMGMGLAISRGIIDAHGGRLWYEANPEGGAIFRFTLRIAHS
jgi:signal transduction histidine kinase